MWTVLATVAGNLRADQGLIAEPTMGTGMNGVEVRVLVPLTREIKAIWSGNVFTTQLIGNPTIPTIHGGAVVREICIGSSKIKLKIRLGITLADIIGDSVPIVNIPPANQVGCTCDSAAV